MRKGWDGEEKCSKGDRMYLTFHILTLKKYLTNNFALYFWDTHIFAPKRDLSPKMSTQVLPLTPFFLLENPFILLQACKTGQMR